MVDPDRIHRRLELLAGYLRELRCLRDLPVAEYLRDDVYAGRYLIQVARRPASIWPITSSPPRAGGLRVISATASPFCGSKA